MSDNGKAQEIFTPAVLAEMFPPQKADQFFDALYGDAADGAYDIELRFRGQRGRDLEFELLLKQRPGKCLACNLTFGLPQVFSRHPIINLKGLAVEVGRRMGQGPAAPAWSLGNTRIISDELHALPITITLS